MPVAGTALLLIDVINDLAFEGSEALVAEAEPMAKRVAALKRRATAAGIPTIYINDNFGQWRSDFRQTVAHCTKATSPGRRVSQRLRPTARDYFVLKPRHSGFFDTTLVPTSSFGFGYTGSLFTGLLAASPLPNTKGRRCASGIPSRRRCSASPWRLSFPHGERSDLATGASA